MMVKSPISQKKLSFLKYGYGKISVNYARVKFNLALSRSNVSSNVYKSITGKMVILVDSRSVSIYPVLYNQAVEVSLPRSGCEPDIAWAL